MKRWLLGCLGFVILVALGMWFGVEILDWILEQMEG